MNKADVDTDIQVSEVELDDLLLAPGFIFNANGHGR